MDINFLDILLADDDIDDCVFFKQAVDELQFNINFTALHDGEQLMLHLNNENNKLPHVLFLDLNMPRKNGFECLSEIKLHEYLNQLPVIMFSTSFEQSMINQLYLNGAQFFIRKPPEFSQFKKIIQQTLTLFSTQLNAAAFVPLLMPTKENFVLVLDK